MLHNCILTSDLCSQTLNGCTLFRYRDRFWRESVFTGVDGIKESLASVYGSGKVSVANAAMRWMVHHSQLDPKYGGMH